MAVKAVIVEPKRRTFLGYRPRRLRLPPKYQFWNHKRAPRPILKPLPNSWSVGSTASKLLWGNKWLLSKILFIYGLISFLLVRGLDGIGDVTGFREDVLGIFSSSVLESFSGVFGFLLSTTKQTNSVTADIYQAISIVLTTMALIYALRKVSAKQKCTLRDAFYDGMEQLVPALLVTMAVAASLIPFIGGGSVYVQIVNAGLITEIGQQVGALFVLALCAALSIYLIIPTTVSIYIAALPGMTPLRALRAGFKLVRYRRWSIIRKLIWGVLVIGFVAVAISIITTLIFAPAIPWVFYVLSLVAFIAAQVYLYTLYRELIEHAPATV